ncbi:MAG TPA: hypothetical protein VIL20_15770 [Sandaracinaceae bacterium]
MGQYWLVDPEARTLEVLAEAAGAHPVPGFERLVAALDALWAELDRGPDEGG